MLVEGEGVVINGYYIECGYCGSIVGILHDPIEVWFHNHLFECMICAGKRFEREFDAVILAERKKNGTLGDGDGQR